MSNQPPRETSPRDPFVGLLPEEARRYEDEGEIARGGMGSVRRVVDVRLGRREAMKVLDPVVARDPRVAGRFVEEARITGPLDHPSIVPIHDLGLSADGSPAFITMKLVEGEDFGAHLDRLGPARFESEALERALRVLLKVCDAVSFAHSRGIIHCDIKPTNIMVGSHGQVYLMDWGLAVALPEHASLSVKGWSPRPLNEGTVCGTPAYMSPEQAHGQVNRIDARTDVFGLGATLYRLLTGHPPYVQPTVALTLAEARAGGPLRPEKLCRDKRLPPELCRIAMKAMEFDAPSRYPTVQAFADDLESFLRGGGWLRTLTFKEGETIIREGEVAEAAYVLAEGVCEVYKTVGGARMPLRLLGPGEVFGEAAVFSAQPRTATVVAKSDVRVKVITADSLELELSRNVWLMSLVKALAHRFREIDTELTAVKRQIAEEAESLDRDTMP